LKINNTDTRKKVIEEQTITNQISHQLPRTFVRNKGIKVEQKYDNQTCCRQDSWNYFITV